MHNKSIYEDGWKWLVEFDWVNCSKSQKFWFSEQIDRFILRFGVSDDEAKRLRAEISEKGVK